MRCSRPLLTATNALFRLIPVAKGQVAETPGDSGVEVDGWITQQMPPQAEAGAVDLRTGKYTDDVDADSYDAREAAKDPLLSTALVPAENVAGASSARSSRPTSASSGTSRSRSSQATCASGEATLSAPSAGSA